jgi:hypothetical protein
MGAAVAKAVFGVEGLSREDLKAEIAGVVLNGW